MVSHRDFVAQSVGFRRRSAPQADNETQQLAPSGLLSRLYPTYA
ncbi:MAG: hypothetical protein AAF485_05615 [Chloroflexota bacterium]